MELAISKHHGVLEFLGRTTLLLVARPAITVDYLAQANEVNKPVNYDPNQDAAPHYEKLLSQFVALPETLKYRHRLWPTDLNPEEFKALEEWASTNESILPTLAEAASCPYWWYELKSPDGAMSNIQRPDPERLRQCGGSR